MNKLPPYITKDTRPPLEIERQLDYLLKKLVVAHNENKCVAKCVVVK